ncbi:MAG TPA: hypothetical protein VGG39_11045 [Polyangiaceae bacterium]
MRSLFALSFAVVVSACSSTSGSPSSDAGQDATRPDGGADAAPQDAAADAPAPDAAACTIDGAAGLSCAESLATFCAGATGDAAANGSWACGTTWQSIQAAPPCSQGLQVGTLSCSSTLQAMAVINPDTADIAFYDPQTGQLIAIGGTGYNTQPFCAAGPSCLSVPSCGSLQYLCAVDAGADGAGSD